MNPFGSLVAYGKEEGQALLIVVLVIVVALTVGLSLASRSITNLRNTTDEVNSQKAFSAAEAGVEQVIKTGAPITSPIDLGNNSQISSVGATLISGSGTAGDEFLLNNGNPIFQDDGGDIWLSPHSDSPLFKTPWGCGIGFTSGNCGQSQTLSLYWGTNTDSCAEPALEVLVIASSSTTNPQVNATMSRYVFDSCAARRTGGSYPNNFSSSFSTVNATINGANGVSRTFNYKVDLPITNGLFVRIIPLYTAGVFGVKASNLPSQGQLITSVGTSGSTGQQTIRKVTFFQGYQSLPSELLYGLFSPK